MIQCNHCQKQYLEETKLRLKDRFNEHCGPVDKQANSSKPTAVSDNFLCNYHNATDMQRLPLIWLNLIVKVHVKQEKKISLKEVKPANLMVLI